MNPCLVFPGLLAAASHVPLCRSPLLWMPCAALAEMAGYPVLSEARPSDAVQTFASEEAESEEDESEEDKSEEVESAEFVPAELQSAELDSVESLNSNPLNCILLGSSAAN